MKFYVSFIVFLCLCVVVKRRSFNIPSTYVYATESMRTERDVPTVWGVDDSGERERDGMGEHHRRTNSVSS